MLLVPTGHSELYRLLLHTPTTDKSIPVTEISDRIFIGGGRNKIKNRLEQGCRFYFEMRSSDWPAPKY
jgi:hypothetical protein